MPRCHLFYVSAQVCASSGSFGLIPTVLQANKAVVKTRIGKHSHDVPGRGVTGDHPPRVEVKDTDIVLAVECYELVGTEAKFSKRRLPCWLESNADTPLAINIYEPCPKL